MAQELPSGDGTNVSPSRYSEQRAPQFTGGDVDPSTGNLVPAGKAQIASGANAAATQATNAATSAPSSSSSAPSSSSSSSSSASPPSFAAGPDAPPPFALPSTRLADMSATPSLSVPKPSLATTLEGAAGSALASFGGRALSSAFGSGSDSNKSPNAGGFASGGNSGSGSSSSSSSNAPINLSPSGNAAGPTGSTAGLDNTTLNGGSSFSPAPAPAPSADYQPAIPASYDPSASVPNFTPDYSKLPNGAYTDTGYVTANGFQPYASDTQRDNFVSGRFGSGYSYYSPSQIPTSSSFDPAGGDYGQSAGPSSSSSFEPSGGDSGGGGGGSDFGADSVICTELHRQGLLVGDTFEADKAFGAMVRLHHPNVYAGYLVWAWPVVKLMRRSVRVTRAVNFVAAPWANFMAIRQGRNGFPSLRGFITFHVGWALCALIGSAMATWRAKVRPLLAST